MTVKIIATYLVPYLTEQSYTMLYPGTSYLYVVDTRPKINAMYNRAAGKGYEAEAFYPNIKFVFKVKRLCNDRIV